MNARAAAGVLSILSLLVLTPGCDRPTLSSVAANRVPASEWRLSNQVVLGSAELTAGIPGEGPLTLDQIRDWLSREEVHEPLDFELPLGFADAYDLVSIPPENPLTRAKIELGRQLFFDKRLSELGDITCATCHRPDQNYSVHGVMPVIGLNPPVVFNRLFSRDQAWDGQFESLEQQVKGPITNRFEMGTTIEACVVRLASIEGYRLQFEAIFGRLDFEAVAAALASFQRALITGSSPWDYRRLLREYEDRAPETLSADERQLVRALREGAREHPMSEAAIRGEALFFSDRTGCYSCHSGPNLTDEAYYNVGIGMADYDPNLGRYKITGRDEDRGAFKTPTLRNVARTVPYMHNGSLASLRDVIEWFDRGGFDHPHLDHRIRPLHLTRDEKQDLVAFLEALSGPLPPVETGRLPE